MEIERDFWVGFGLYGRVISSHRGRRVEKRDTGETNELERFYAHAPDAKNPF